MKNGLIIWADINETGIPIIDEQHRGIVSTINSLFYFMRKKRGVEIMRPTIETINQYTKIHFLTEERLLEQAGYPGLEEHKKLHKALIDELLHTFLITTRAEDPSKLLQFLKIWWTNHINGNDRAYTMYMLKANVNFDDL